MVAHTPEPPSTRFMTRQARLAVRHPQASSALNRISDSIKPIKYGEKISRILQNYHFANSLNARTFFSAYLKRHSGKTPDDEMLNKYLLDTINVSLPSLPSGVNSTQGQFELRCDLLIAAINRHEAQSEPLLNFFIGPTGAGKTFFSKSLFTICLGKFWHSRTIPTRVEYSKFEHRDEDNNINEDRFFAFVRRCMFRDLMIFLFLSKELSVAQRRSFTSEPIFSFEAEAFESLHAITDAIDFDGESQNLDAKLRGAIQDAWMEIPDERRDALLYEISSRLNVRFLISFDGFDCVMIEDFLFGRSTPLPILYLTNLLKSLNQKTAFRKIFNLPVRAHFAVYLRDTSFERLKMELLRGVGKSHDFPVNWIVPPRYSELVQNVASFLTGETSGSKNLATTFAQDMHSVFDSYVFRDLKLTAATHLNFLFGSNARRMNHHIYQSLIASLYRASIKGTFDFTRISSGIDARTVWLELVRNHSVRTLPRYQILEDLFLHDSRQLIPRLEVDAKPMAADLLSGNVAGAIRKTRDRDESGGIFGCMFNYLVPIEVTGSDRSLPGLLILIRIVQFVQGHYKCNGAEVCDFIRSIGYSVNDSTVEYFLYVLLRTEMVRFDGSTGNRSISNVPLFVTTRGEIAIEAILRSVTYLSEAILVSLHSDRDITKHLAVRNQDNAVWVVDCVWNASVAIELIRQIELIEDVVAAGNGVNIKPYLLAARLFVDLSDEARTIVGSSAKGSAAAQEAARDLLVRISGIKALMPQFRLLGEMN